MSPNSPAPFYSQTPDASERVLQTGHCQCITGDSSAADAQKLAYKSDNLEVRLHPPRWGSVFPAYGLDGIVEGTVTFRKPCTYVQEVSVSLQGVLTTSASQHAGIAVPGVHKIHLVRQKVVLVTAPAGSTTTVSGEYSFAPHFPHYVEGGTDPLPPSYTLYQPGVSTEITYHLRVDIVRKGMRRHEKLLVPILYLPKSRPTLPPLEHIPWSVRVDSTQDARVSDVVLEPTWPKGCTAATQRTVDLPLITLTMPKSKCFTSGDTIPLAIKIECPGSPVLAQLLSSNAHVCLVKRQKAWVSMGEQVSIREYQLSHAKVFLADETQEGTAYLRMELQAGEAGRECSWRIEGAVSVEHVIRLVISPPEHVKEFPIYRREVPVRLTTDHYGSLQNELLAMNGVPFPALGLSDPNRHLRVPRPL
ncbi:hypothetical protein C2E23DRAFT_726968 [Lenzites betulinus]|nr:hypothetical protein C2E23DRAFT_726968 [Lenzites betulinus]